MPGASRGFSRGRWARAVVAVIRRRPRDVPSYRSRQDRWHVSRMCRPCLGVIVPHRAAAARHYHGVGVCARCGGCRVRACRRGGVRVVGFRGVQGARSTARPWFVGLVVGMGGHRRRQAAGTEAARVCSADQMGAGVGRHCACGCGLWCTQYGYWGVPHWGPAGSCRPSGVVSIRCVCRQWLPRVGPARGCEVGFSVGFCVRGTLQAAIVALCASVHVSAIFRCSQCIGLASPVHTPAQPLARFRADPSPDQALPWPAPRAVLARMPAQKLVHRRLKPPHRRGFLRSLTSAVWRREQLKP